MAVREPRRAGDLLPVQGSPVLAPEVFQHRPGRIDQDPRVAARDGGIIDRGEGVLLTSEQVFARSQRELPVSRASKPAVMPLLYKPTAAELTAAEKEANCLVRPSNKSSDLLTSLMRR